MDWFQGGVMKNRVFLSIIIFFLFLLLIKFSALAGTIYYVEQNHPQASDRNPGSSELPWETIQHAADMAHPGDLVYVKPGNYYERVIVQKSGSAGNLLNFKATGTVITRGFTVLADYIRIEGFEVTNTLDHWRDGHGIFLQGTGHEIIGNEVHHTRIDGIACSDREPYCKKSLIKNNIIQYADGTGIVIFGFDNIVEANDISHSVDTLGGDADGIRFFGQGHIIRKNFIHDITNAEAPDAHTDCFQTFDNSKPPTNNILIESNICRNVDHQCLMASAETKRQSSHIIFRNNICDNNGWQAIYILQIPGSTIVNNTFAEKIRARAIILQDGAQDTNILNNIFYGPYVPYEMDSSCLPGFSADYNLKFPGTGTPWKEPHGLWNHAPQFVDPAKRDFHLRPESPAKDAGMSLLEVTMDLEGNSRPQGAGYDIGAYEYLDNPHQSTAVWLKLNDDLTDGIAEDSSGNGCSAKCSLESNCPSFLPNAGHDGGGAYLFDGTKSYLDLGPSRFGIDQTDAFTISFWIRPQKNTSGNFSSTIIRRSQYDYPFSVDLDRKGRIIFYLRTDKNYSLTSRANLIYENWNHVAVTYQKGSRIIYINGVEDSSDRVNNPLHWGYSSSMLNTFLGKIPGGAGYFKGALDDVRIYEIALEAEVIYQLYRSQIP
jgi:hypothetical protein